MPPPDGTALRLTDVTVRYGGVTAVDGVSFSIPTGTVVGLIGANGAGKTTILDAICGFVPSTGRVEVHGREISQLPPYQRARTGLGRSFQDGRLFASLTVAETVCVALERHSDRIGPFNACIGVGPSRRAERALAGEVAGLLEQLGLVGYRDKLVSELSTGTRRIVDLACSVAHRPDVLLLDEPSSGIAQRESEALAPLLLQIREDLGCSIVIIEHDMPLVRAVASHLVALETGRVIAEGEPGAVLTDARVVESYLGGDDVAVHRSGAATTCTATTKSGSRCRRAPSQGTRCAQHAARPKNG